MREAVGLIIAGYTLAMVGTVVTSLICRDDEARSDGEPSISQGAGDWRA